jgi:hypothetical protein
MPRYDMDKDWCANMAKLEDGQEIGAGFESLHRLQQSTDALKRTVVEVQQESPAVRNAMERYHMRARIVRLESALRHIVELHQLGAGPDELGKAVNLAADVLAEKQK